MNVGYGAICGQILGNARFPAQKRKPIDGDCGARFAYQAKTATLRSCSLRKAL